MTGTPLMEIATIHRPETQAAHIRSVERVIATMRENLCEPLPLEDMADVACLSPYHFNRVFRQITGIPPAQFLYALRIEQAKRLLVNTEISVTDTCFETGYNSLGSFTSRFTKLVGVSPNEFRRLIKQLDGFRLGMVRALVETQCAGRKPNPGARLKGTIYCPQAPEGLIFAGFFHRPIPESRPIACAILDRPGVYELEPNCIGKGYVFSATLPWSAGIRDLLTLDCAFRGRSGELLVGPRGTQGETNVRLRPNHVIHPPILAAMPLLVASRLAIPLPVCCDGHGGI